MDFYFVSPKIVSPNHPLMVLWVDDSVLFLLLLLLGLEGLKEEATSGGSGEVMEGG